MDLVSSWREQAAQIEGFAPEAARALRTCATQLERRDAELARQVKLEAVSVAEPSWRERLWVVPAETRLNRTEVLEALDKSRTWLYRTGLQRLPHRKDVITGELVFLAGEVRDWLERNHVVIIAA